MGNLSNFDKKEMEEDLYGGKNLLEFEKKKIPDWSQDDVLKFLNAIGFGNLIDIFQDKAKDGKELLSVSFQDQVFSSLEDRTRKILFVYLHHLRHCAIPKSGPAVKFSLKFHRVCQKILKGLGGEDFRFKHLEAQAAALSNRQKIKEYLLPHNQEEENEDKLKVKLIITESIFNPKEQLLRKIVSPILSNFVPKFSPEFGLFHSAIIIGPFYLHWTNTELVIPKKIESGAAFVSIDTDPVTIDEDRSFDQLKDKIALVIERWNTDRIYAQMPKKREEGNCQDFIFDLTHEIGIDLNIQEGTPFADYLKKLKKQGRYKIQFKCSQEFETKFKLSECPESKNWEKSKTNLFKVEFMTHRQLDDFLYYCHVSNPVAAEHEFRDEYRLLKSFDRAFWLRHLKEKNEDRWLPAQMTEERKYGSKPFESGCPFSDPRGTGTYRV